MRSKYILGIMLIGWALFTVLGGCTHQQNIGSAASHKAAVQPGDGECFYRLLGAFRSVSEALVRYADAAPGIEWSRWREERFV